MSRYLLISLPTSISPSNDRDEAVTALRSSVPHDSGTTYPFAIPTFKIGALDALINQADDLAKLCSDCEAVVGKVGEALTSLFDGDTERARGQRNVDNKPVDQYIQTFTWNKVKYRMDKPIAELITSLKKELASIDTDVRTKMSSYNTCRQNLSAAQKKQSGNLSTRSLTTIIDPADLVTSSEYLEPHILAVPKQLVKDFLKTYESLAPMVVPRSAVELAKDSEFTLYGVTTFKKTAADFAHKAREKRWTPRELPNSSGGLNGSGAEAESEAQEISRYEAETQRLGGEALRLARTGYSEAAMTWIHALALRTFVESILRYGLPASFVAGVVRTTTKGMKNVRKQLDSTYAYLGGKGQEGKGGGGGELDPSAAGEGEWSAYVCYEIGVE